MLEVVSLSMANKDKRSGGSARTLNRVVAEVVKETKRQTTNLPEATTAKTVNKIYSSCHPSPVLKYKQVLCHIQLMNDKENMMHLQQSGAMTDIASYKFNKVLKVMTGMSVYQKKVTMGKISFSTVRCGMCHNKANTD